MSEDRAAPEASVRELCTRGDVDGAVAAALKGYGPEVYGYLVAVLRSDTEAGDAFSMWSEDLWKGLGSFAWESSLRTWAYVLARHAVARLQRGARRKMVPLDDASAVGRIAAEVRTATQSFLRTEQKDKFAALRASLSPEDQALLVLRVDRAMAWEDLARVLGDSPRADVETLRRESARLRKRFERLRADLLERGRRAGLIGRDK